MRYPNLRTMESFEANAMPTLDIAVLGALERFERDGLPKLDLGGYRRPLVVGSGNAHVTGAILFEGTDAVFADESTFPRKLAALRDTAGGYATDGAVLISASGAKHAPGIARELSAAGIETRLLTCNPDAPARTHVRPELVYVFPRNREPYTYNTSTYLGMILAKTGEKPTDIRQFIVDRVRSCVRDSLSADYDACYVVVREEHDALREMLRTKFDELFGPMLAARCFTMAQTKHAKTVVTSNRELFISLDTGNQSFGDLECRVEVPLPKDAGPGSVMAIGYWVIGLLQSKYPPYFINAIHDYVHKASRVFGDSISAIVG